MRFPNNSKTLIGSIYRPPNTDLDDFKTNLEKVLETISSERARATLVGDLNVTEAFSQLFNFVTVKPTRTGADPPGGGGHFGIFSQF